MRSARFFEIEDWMQQFASGVLSESGLLDILESFSSLVDREVSELYESLSDLREPRDLTTLLASYEECVGQFFEVFCEEDEWSDEVLDEALSWYETADVRLSELEDQLTRDQERELSISI